ncbi:MAG: precorrin-6y C5,15-methyltransferase (decarboxylating) subunit CbiE [Clostridium sp.]
MRVYIVGVGTGSLDELTSRARKTVESSDIIIGAKRLLKVFSHTNILSVEAYLGSDVVRAIKENNSLAKVVILVSGDVGFFSATKNILTKLNCDVELIPGISSLAYMSSKISLSWDDMNIVSLHGRDKSIIGNIMKNKKTFILTDKVNNVGVICRTLYDVGFRDLKVHVGENLSYDNEKITTGSINKLMNNDFAPLSVMVVENSNTVDMNISTGGIMDCDFVRGDAPMTKSEVRRISISKLNLLEDDIIYDIGAGTGSVAIEMALTALNGEVYAVEKNPKSVELIKINRSKFLSYNLKVIEGTAPEVLDILPPPDKVFIGGSSGNMDEIIEAVL